jgi:hypothetical protein
VGIRDVIIKNGGESMKYETPELHPSIALIGAIQGTTAKNTAYMENMTGDPKEAVPAYADWE